MLTDFLSFYTLPSTVMHHATHKSLRAAYAFYNVAQSRPLQDLLTDVLIVAKNVSLSPVFFLVLVDVWSGWVGGGAFARLFTLQVGRCLGGSVGPLRSRDFDAFVLVLANRNTSLAKKLDFQRSFLRSNSCFQTVVEIEMFLVSYIS